MQKRFGLLAEAKDRQAFSVATWIEDKRVRPAVVVSLYNPKWFPCRATTFACYLLQGIFSFLSFLACLFYADLSSVFVNSGGNKHDIDSFA